VKLHNLFESFYSYLDKQDLESVIAQFAFGLGKHLHDRLLASDAGLVVQVFPDAVEVSGGGGEARVDIDENAVTIGGNVVSTLTDNSSLWAVAAAMQEKRRHSGTKKKGLSDNNLLERIEEEIRKSLGLT
jgi:hypothetical protein